MGKKMLWWALCFFAGWVLFLVVGTMLLYGWQALAGTLPQPKSF